MTPAQSTTTSRPSAGHDVLNAARYYVGNRWAFVLVPGSLAIGAGLYFGGWGWLVAIGAAPIILSTLPCLIMCGLGVCMMCRSNKSQSAASHGAAGVATSSAPLSNSELDRPSSDGSSCCHAAPIEAQSPRATQAQSLDQ